MNATSLQRLSQVHPTLETKIQVMAAQLEREGIPIEVTQGLRSWEDQDALYAVGRTIPGRIVTEVRGGYSQHNFGLAVDLVPEDIVPGEPDWNIQHPAWKRMIEVGESLGLTSGSEWVTFPDNPHFQLTGNWPVTPDDAQRAVYQNGGLPAVWEQSGLSLYPESQY